MGKALITGVIGALYSFPLCGKSRIQMIAPQYEAQSLTPSVEWQAVPHAQEYRLRVTSDSCHKSSTAKEILTTKTSLQVNLEHDGWWHICLSAWSDKGKIAEEKANFYVNLAHVGSF